MTQDSKRPKDFLVKAEQGRNDLFALLGTPIRYEDNMQVIYTIKYLFPNAKEVCLSNNNLSDRHTAEIITQIADERDLLSKI